MNPKTFKTMRNILVAVVSIFMVTSVTLAQEKDNDVNPEPVETGENYAVYGSEFPDDAQFFAPGYLVRNADIFEGDEVETQGKIKQVCQKKGCFFILPAGDQNIRVTFKDYDFFIPKNSAGKKVQLVGEFQTNELSEEKAKHYAKDAGEDSDEVKGPQQEYGIVATSVKIIDTEK